MARTLRSRNSHALEPRLVVDGAAYDVDCLRESGARVFAAPEEAFKLHVDAVEAELRRRRCMGGTILNLSTTPDLQLSYLSSSTFLVPE